MSEAPQLTGLLTLADETRFKIRLDVKPVTDTHMIYESWGRLDYTPPGFEIENDHHVIDIGAHIGAFTVYAAKRATKGAVYAYEPHPENFAILQENIHLNGLSNVHAYQVGVLDARKDSELYVDGSNNAGHSLYNQAETALTIQCVSLASVFDDNNLEFCDLLKIDCEGAEYDILFALPATYFNRIGAIAMEYHDGMYKKKQ